MRAHDDDRTRGTAACPAEERLRRGASGLLALICLLVGAEAGGNRPWFGRPGWARDSGRAAGREMLRCGVLIERQGPPESPWPAAPEAASDPRQGSGATSGRGGGRMPRTLSNPEPIRP